MSSSALAKARLLTVEMRAASKLQLSATCLALLATLIAESWDRDGRWIARGRISHLAVRLSVSTDTITRSLRQLVDRQLIEYTPGIGVRTSRFVVGVRIHADSESASVRTGVRTHAESESAPVRTQRHQSADGSTSSSSDGAAAEIQKLLRRPEWLNERLPWIDQETARSIASSSTTEVVIYALRLARDRRNTLTNPAGYFIRQCRDPDLVEVQRLASLKARAHARNTTVVPSLGEISLQHDASPAGS